MKPYYEEPGIQIYLGDCREILPQLEPVDCVITDPPYSDHVHAKNMRGLTAWAGEISEHRDLGFSALDPITRLRCAIGIGRLCRRWALVFSDVESSHLWREELTFSGALEYLRTGIWLKRNGAPQFTGDRPAVAFETITICHPPGKKRWNGGGRQGFWESYEDLVYRHNTAIDRRHDGSERRVHTTQKPLSLMTELVGLFSEPDETILDPFMGSGTTLVAAKNLGRRAVGIELEERYCEAAVKRLAQAILL